MLDIYTPPEAAAEILNQRRNDPNIRDRVVEYLGGLLPGDCLDGEKPVAILANYVARGTLEDRVFAEQAEDAGLIPYWATYFEDAFTTTNPQKVDTIRPPILWPKGQRTRQWVVNKEDRNGPVGFLKTIYGGTSSEFQQSLRSIRLTEDGRTDLLPNTFDLSEWYKAQAERFGQKVGERLAPFYAVARTALTTTFYAYYHDYDYADPRFMREVLYPSIDKVRSDLGLTPVIVKLPKQPGFNETDLSFLDSDEVEQVKKQGYLPVKSAKVENYE